MCGQHTKRPATRFEGEWHVRAYLIASDYLHGFITEGQRRTLLRELGLAPTPPPRPLPIYCPPEFYWRACECGRQGQKEDQ